jgi:ribosomal subunit interface protein
LDVEIGKNITVGSSNVEIGEALTTRAKQELVDLASKYFGKLTTASVHFSPDGHQYRCTIHMQPGGVATVNAEAHHKAAHGALDLAIEKLRAQLSRLKEERRDNKQARGPEH